MFVFIRILISCLIGIVFLKSCSIIERQDNSPLESSKYEFNYRQWLPKNESDILILAVHGYNAHAGSFEIPAKIFTKFDIEIISFDLRGFGTNKDFGEWYPIEVHVADVEAVLQKISQENPKKKIFLLGESMGAAIAISLVSQKKNLPISGLILVSPALWNFSQNNPIKSFIMKSFSNLFPNVRLSGQGIIKVRPSDNLEMLRKYSDDPLVIHNTTAKSLSGIIQLMDKSYEESKIFLQNPSYQTLIVIPGIDEIVPRKPIIALFGDIDINSNLNKKIFLAFYDKNFHMILRDIDGDRISWEIKEWIINRKRVLDFQAYNNAIQRLGSSKFFHELD